MLNGLGIATSYAGSPVAATFVKIGNSDNSKQERIEFGALPKGNADD